MNHYQLYPLALAAMMSFPSAASANKIRHLDIGPLQGFAEAPAIEVYSTDGEKWNTVDKSRAVTFKIKLNAQCQYEGRGNKAYDGDLTVPGFAIIGDTQPADFLIPHSHTAEASFRYVDGAGQPIQPAQICATELTKRLSENKNLTKYHILSKGFTVDYAGAFRVKYQLYCRATGLGKSDLGSDSTLVNARIHCAASDLAEAKIPQPPAKLKVLPARLTRLIENVGFKAEPPIYRGNCPVNIRFKGSITATRAGMVKYQYVSGDGRKSPEFTLQFKAAGTQATRTWSRTLGKPDPGARLATAAGGNAWDHQGWYRLDILDPEPSASTRANYQVACGAAKPARAVKQEPK